MALFDDERPDESVDEELRFHLEGRVRELMSAGLDRATAEAEVRRRFGDPERIAAECVDYDHQRIRRARRRSRIDALRLDARLAWRGLVRDRGIAAAVVLTLALTIGAVTALFSVTDALLLRPLPYPNDDALVYVWQNDRLTGTTREGAGTADFYDFRARSTSFASMSMFALASGTLAADDRTTFVPIARVQTDLVDVLGVEPILGRSFLAEEAVPGGPEVVLLSESLWRSEFDRDPSVIGRTVTLGGTRMDVVGVLPEGAETLLGTVGVWVPLRITAAEATRNPHFVTVVGRLRPGVDAAAAQSEMTSIAAQLEAEVPDNANRGAFVEPVADFLRADLRATLWTLFGATLLLLLLGAANVASLLSARATRRDRVTAVHTALGAGPGRTLARGWVEAALVLSVSTLLGIGVAVGGVELLRRRAPAELFGTAVVSLDLRVLVFTVAVAAVLTLTLGSIPIRHALRQDLQRSLGHGAAGRSRSGRGMAVLVSGQAALATVLLVGSLLLGATLRNLLATDLGFDTGETLRATIVLPDARYPRDFADYPDWPEIVEFERRVSAALEEVPGVRSAALMFNHPLDPGFTNSIGIEGRTVPDGVGEIRTRMITPSYFETAGVQVVDGRPMSADLGPTDDGEVVLNRTAARLLFPDGDALGNRIAFWGPTWREIVGIVEDERIDGQRESAPPAFYTSLFHTPPAQNPLLVLVRAQGDPTALGPAIQQTVLDIEPDAAVHDVATMAETVGDRLARERLAGTLLAAFAAIALFLSAIGVHAVLAFSVASRRREIGVRLALGESRGGVRRRVLGRAIALVGSGVALGLVVALAGAGLLEALLFAVDAREPLVYLGAAGLLIVVGLAGAGASAARAAAVEPASSLRSE